MAPGVARAVRARAARLLEVDRLRGRRPSSGPSRTLDLGLAVRAVRSRLEQPDLLAGGPPRGLAERDERAAGLHPVLQRRSPSSPAIAAVVAGGSTRPRRSAAGRPAASEPRARPSPAGRSGARWCSGPSRPRARGRRSQASSTRGDLERDAPGCCRARSPRRPRRCRWARPRAVARDDRPEARAKPRVVLRRATRAVPPGTAAAQRERLEVGGPHAHSGRERLDHRGRRAGAPRQQVADLRRRRGGGRRRARISRHRRGLRAARAVGRDDVHVEGQRQAPRRQVVDLVGRRARAAGPAPSRRPRAGRRAGP
jgi:hypothetical protein